jgi:hypothetical protein
MKKYKVTEEKTKAGTWYDLMVQKENWYKNRDRGSISSLIPIVNIAVAYLDRYEQYCGSNDPEVILKTIETINNKPKKTKPREIKTSELIKRAKEHNTKKTR